MHNLRKEPSIYYSYEYYNIPQVECKNLFNSYVMYLNVFIYVRVSSIKKQYKLYLVESLDKKIIGWFLAM